VLQLSRPVFAFFSLLLDITSLVKSQALGSVWGIVALSPKPLASEQTALVGGELHKDETRLSGD
jgi:hypothetical protein